MCLCLPYFIPWHSDFHLIIPLKQLLSKSQPFLITYWNRTCSDLCHWIFQPSPLESLTPYFLTYCLLLISAAAFVWISSARRHLLFFFFSFGFFLILCFYIAEFLSTHYLILFLISYTFTLEMWSMFMHLNVIFMLIKIKVKQMEYVLWSVWNLT